MEKRYSPPRHQPTSEKMISPVVLDSRLNSSRRSSGHHTSTSDQDEERNKSSSKESKLSSTRESFKNGSKSPVQERPVAVSVKEIEDDHQTNQPKKRKEEDTTARSPEKVSTAFILID